MFKLPVAVTFIGCVTVFSGCQFIDQFLMPTTPTGSVLGSYNGADNYFSLAESVVDKLQNIKDQTSTNSSQAFIIQASNKKEKCLFPSIYAESKDSRDITWIGKCKNGFASGMGLEINSDGSIAIRNLDYKSNKASVALVDTNAPSPYYGSVTLIDDQIKRTPNKKYSFHRFEYKGGAIFRESRLYYKTFEDQLFTDGYAVKDRFSSNVMRYSMYQDAPKLGTVVVKMLGQNGYMIGDEKRNISVLIKTACKGNECVPIQIGDPSKNDNIIVTYNGPGLTPSEEDMQTPFMNRWRALKNKIDNLLEIKPFKISAKEYVKHLDFGFSVCQNNPSVLPYQSREKFCSLIKETEKQIPLVEPSFQEFKK